MSVKKCNECGKEINERDLFCQYCGCKLNSMENDDVNHEGALDSVYITANGNFTITFSKNEITFDQKVFSKHYINKIMISEVMDFYYKDRSKWNGTMSFIIVTKNGIIKQNVDYWKNDGEVFSNFVKYFKNVIQNNPKEIRKKCKVCGKVFCFNAQDILKNYDNTKNMVISSAGSVGSLLVGTRYDMYELGKKADNAESKIVDFNKCPSCGSIDLEEITKKEIVEKKEHDSIDAVAEIKKYKELLDEGIINQEEFDKKKKELLGL